MSDNVNHPNHYNRGKIETIEYMKETMSKEKFEGFCIGNCMKVPYKVF